MAYGVHLGILLVCLVQAEHVCCLWVTQAQSSQRQNGNIYAGFSQQDDGLRRLEESPQNQLRQASVSPRSAQSSSLNKETAGSSAYRQELSSSAYSQSLSQPAQGGYASVKLTQSNLLSKPNWQTIELNQVNMPKKQFSGLSSSLASGNSLTDSIQNQNDLTDISKRTWPTQQGTLRASNYLSSSFASVQSPSKSNSLKSASHQSAVQQAPSAAAAETGAAYYGRRGYSPSVISSSMLSPGAPVPQKKSIQSQTSARALARRVSSRRSSKTAKPSSFSSPQNGGIGNNPSQAEAVKPYQSKLFSMNKGNAQGSYQPASMSNIAYSQESYSQSLPVSKHNAPVGFQPHSLEMPTSQRWSYNPSYTSIVQLPSSMSPLKASWNSNSAQGARNFPASGNGRAGTSAQGFAPTRTHSIPQRFGGSAIRRLKEPADQTDRRIGKPQQTYTAPSQQTVSYKPQVQSVHQSKWQRIRPNWGH
ncbi:uncharacterized protein LOC122863965 [Siniperca chuatsi]|uniref:uncharacterized protein LOC122863965 n=1 Tax=Siniperca chuatsi TaxID=119488 RepID=UPI001CE14FAE|nr:uncharacterized protein LOC122863965 [Siniperca chuatsi]